MKTRNTGSNRELGSAPVKAATKIRRITWPRGITIASLLDIYCSLLLEFARSNTSAKKVNIEFEASLQTKRKGSIGINCNYRCVIQNNTNKHIWWKVTSNYNIKSTLNQDSDEHTSLSFLIKAFPVISYVIDNEDQHENKSWEIK